MEKIFYTVSDLVKLIGEENISRGAVYGMINRGRIPAVIIGSRRLIPVAWVEEHILKPANIKDINEKS